MANRKPQKIKKATGKKSKKPIVKKKKVISSIQVEIDKYWFLRSALMPKIRSKRFTHVNGKSIEKDMEDIAIGISRALKRGKKKGSHTQYYIKYDLKTKQINYYLTEDESED